MAAGVIYVPEKCNHNWLTIYFFGIWWKERKKYQLIISLQFFYSILKSQCRTKLNLYVRVNERKIKRKQERNDIGVVANGSEQREEKKKKKKGERVYAPNEIANHIIRR